MVRENGGARPCNITRAMPYCNMVGPPLNEIFKYKDKKSKDKAIL